MFTLIVLNFGSDIHQKSACFILQSQQNNNKCPHEEEGKSNHTLIAGHTFLLLPTSWLCPQSFLALPTHLPGFAHGPSWLCLHTFVAFPMDLPGFAHTSSWLCPHTFLALPTHLPGFAHTPSWHCHSHRFLLVWVWPILASVCDLFRLGNVTLPSEVSQIDTFCCFVMFLSQLRAYNSL